MGKYKNKKVLYVNYVNSIRDGAATHVTEFIRHFSEIAETDGFEFEVVSPLSNGGNSTSDSGRTSQLKFLLGKYYLRDFKVIAQQFTAYRRELQMLRDKQPNVVLVRYNGRNLSILYACRKLRIPCVLEVNASDTEKPDGDYKRLPFVQKMILNNAAIGLVDRAFVVSQTLKQEILSRFKDRREYDKKIEVIPNGVDVEKFFPGPQNLKLRSSLNIPKGSVVLGYIGGFSPWHEVEKLVDVIKNLREMEKHVHLLLVGSENKFAESLKHYVTSLAMNDHVTFTGFIDFEKAPEYINLMDIAVLPNTAYYCSPLKLFEYMAMSKAIVCVNTEPVANILQAMHEGALFPQGDYAAMQASILEYVDDDNKRGETGRAARDSVVRNYTWLKNAERVYALISPLFAGKKN